MAAPRLRLRRGTANPQTLTDAGETFALSPALVGEPFFADTDGTVPTVAGTGSGDFYIADGGTDFVHIGGSSYTARTDEFLTAAITTAGGAGGELTFTEGGPTVDAETVTIKAPDGGDMTGSYTMILPVNKPAVAGDYLLEYDQATEQLSFVASGAGEQLLTQQAPDDADATPDEYYLTFVDSNNPNGSPELETFYTEAQLVFQPDKDANVDGTNISSLQITGEYVASTGFFSGTGSTDATAVTTNFATEPTANLLTKTVNIGTGGLNGSAANINIGVTSGTTTINSPIVVGAATTQNVFNTVAETVNAFGAATNIDIGAATGTMSINNATVDLDGDLNVDGGDITTNSAAFNLLNTTATDINAFGAATTIEIGAGGSTTNINGTTANTLGTLDGALVVDGGASVAGNTTIGGDLAVEGGDIVGDPAAEGAAVSLYDTSTGTVNVAGASGTLNLGNDGTVATTVNIATGATGAATTKTVNIATNGDVNSTTAVNIGSATEPDQTTVTINGNLTVTGQQTVTNIQTTNTNITDALITLNDGVDGSLANNVNDIGLFLERGTNDENVFVGFDESTDYYVVAFTSSANTATGNLAFQSAIVTNFTGGAATGDTGATPLDLLPLQIGSLRISDSTSRRTDDLSAEGQTVDEVVIGHLTAGEADTEFSVTDGIAGRYVYNVVIDGGSF